MLKKFISSQHFNAILTVKFCPCVKLILHETIRNDDFWRNTALQCWNSTETIRNNVATLCCVKNCSCESSCVTWFPVLRDTANPFGDDEPPFSVLFSFVQRRFIC